MRKDFLIFLSASLLILIFFVSSNFSSKTTKSVEQLGDGYNADLSGQFNESEQFAYFDGNNVEVPESVLKNEKTNVLGSVSESRWIEVDLSDQKLYAWEGNKLFLETLVSTGLPGTPTPQGEFRIWIKLRATKMEGGQGRGYYYLPNVPYVMFFENSEIASWRGYSLHGTYWHSDFGKPKSHGCVNLPTPIAQQLYQWTSPELVGGKSLVRADNSNLGTRIAIHE